LPIGSTLDTRNGVFYWQPGPGFIGTYRFIFVMKGTNGPVRREAAIAIKPKNS
jgi:hypothetical protein